MPDPSSDDHNTPLTSGFMVFHGNRLEDLRELLVQTLKRYPLAPLQEEVILVQSNGMKHWLELALAADEALGICAATRLELPSAFLWRAYRSVLGPEHVPLRMPFDKELLVWRLMRVLPVLTQTHEVYRPLQRYLDDAGQGRKLYQLALQLADVLDGYQSYRADWLTDWARGTPGSDVLRRADGRTEPLLSEHAWQAQLWRDLRADVGSGLAELSRAGVHERFLKALTPGRSKVQASTRPLPPRVVVFGISSLSQQAVEALAALGHVCQVMMFVQNPCRYYWGDLVDGHALLQKQIMQRQPDKAQTLSATKGMASGHPLLASWGKQGRDYLHLLDRFDQTDQQRSRFERVDLFVDPLDSSVPTRLQQLQSCILHLENPPAQPVASDTSIQFVSTHAARREVEVLHDQLWAWLDADEALEPSEIMVMVPDMEMFAPHIRAVFGRFVAGHPRHLPYALADTSVRQSPLVQALDQLLGLPQSRVSVVDWLALFEVDTVRQRFGLSESDVEQLQQWLSEAGVRWGLDEQHRARWGVSPQVVGAEQNTWAFGIRRLLLGYARPEGVPWQGISAVAGMGSLDAPVVSGWLQWFDAIDTTLDDLSTARSPAEWHPVLNGLLERFFLAEDPIQERALQRLREPLDRWLSLCQDARLEQPVPLEVVREHWLSQLDEPRLGQRFFGGGVQFGTLMPMRSIPFKVVCLLGMNDGDYPRQASPRDFDLMGKSWRVGDRSRREDDRYLFLEALLSARQKLYISWQGRSASDNSVRPPSVLVAQLMDHLQTAWGTAVNVQEHPLQPFSPLYYQVLSPLWTYDEDWQSVHWPKPSDRLKVTEAPRENGIPHPERLSWDDLTGLLRHPVEVFLRRRLGLRLDSVSEAVRDEEPFVLDGLESYIAGQQLLEAPDLQAAAQALRLSGQLPMAAFGERSLQQMVQRAEVVRQRSEPWAERYPCAWPALDLSLVCDGVVLEGPVDGLWGPSDARHPETSEVLRIERRFSAILEKSKQLRGRVLLGFWVRHLALNAQGYPATSVLHGFDAECALKPMPAPQAREHLTELVRAYRLAWEAPAPVSCNAAWAYLLKRGKGHEAALEAAQAAFEGQGDWAQSAYLQRAFSGFDEVAEALPDWAHRLYEPLANQLGLSDQAEEGEA